LRRIQPSNEGRGYVLRRSCAARLRYARTPAFTNPSFTTRGRVADTMADVLPRIRCEEKHVQDVIRTGEEAFNRTLDMESESSPKWSKG